MIRLSILSFAVAVAFFPGAASAQALPAPTSTQNLVGSSVLQYIKNRGFAANDPRAYATVRGVSKVLAAQATAVAAGTIAGTAAVGTAPAWGSILVAAAISVGIGYAVDIAVDGTIKWIMAPGDKPVTQQSLYQPTTSWELAPVNGQTPSCTMASDVVNHCAKFTGGTPASLGSMCIAGSNPTSPCSYGQATSLEQAMDISGYIKSVPREVSSSPLTVSESISGFSSADLAKKLSPAAVAVLVNSALKTASADPEYQGVPYVDSSAVTSQQVQALPEYVAAAPTVGDFVAPQSSPSTSFAPAVDSGAISTGTSSGSTSTVTESSPTTAPGSIPTASPSATEVNLGADPGIGAPVLEPTPTPEMILAPLLGMMPSLKAYTVPSHTGTCPTPSFEFYGEVVTMTAQCELLEGQRQTIHSMMLAVFALASLFIILRA